MSYSLGLRFLLSTVWLRFPLYFVTKNRCVTHVKIRGYANLVLSLLAYLISAVASWFSNSILSRSRMLLQIACYCNVTLFSIAGKF